MTDAFGASRIKVKPPERGVFPLDHDGECKADMQKFLSCLKDNKQDHFPCKNFSKAYLECRMQKDLMAKEDPKHFGLDDDPNYKRASGVELADDNKKESKGFVAGTNVRASNKCYFFCK